MKSVMLWCVAVKQVAEASGGTDILVNNAAFHLHCERQEGLERAHLQHAPADEYRRLHPDDTGGATASE